MDRLEAAVEERRVQVAALRARVNAVADKLFAPFSKKVGVASIRQWEEQHAEFEASVAARRAELEGQRAKLEGQVGYERGRDLDGPAEKRRAELDRDKKQLEELEAKVRGRGGEGEGGGGGRQEVGVRWIWMGARNRSSRSRSHRHQQGWETVTLSVLLISALTLPLVQWFSVNSTPILGCICL